MLVSDNDAVSFPGREFVKTQLELEALIRQQQLANIKGRKGKRNLTNDNNNNNNEEDLQPIRKKRKRGN